MVALFVVLTFILFILIDFLVLRARGEKHPAFSAVKVFDSGFMNPGNVYLSSGHTWLEMIKEGLVRIGIDEFVQKTLSGLKFSTILTEGSRVKRGDILFTALSSDKIINFYAPVTGTVRNVNSEGGRKIEDPYKSWFISLQPENLENEIKSLRSKEAASSWLTQEYARLKDFLSFHSGDAALAGATLHDGGNIVEGAVSSLSTKSVKEFENQFLKVN